MDDPADDHPGAEPSVAGDKAAAYEALVQFLYSAPIGLVQASDEGAIDLINPRAAQLLIPLSRNGGLENLFELLAGVAPELRAQVQAHAAPSGVVCEGQRLEVPTPSGPQVLSLSLLKAGATRLMVVINDVTAEVRRERQRLARRLTDAARTDPITQLPNRAALCEHLQGVLARCSAAPAERERMAVFFLNGDRFKQINDLHGHAAGDRVLAAMGERLAGTLRARSRGEIDSLGPMTARVGGDEFVVVLDDLSSPDDVHVIAQRLLQVLGQPYGLGSEQLHCPVSLGVVLGAQAVGDADAVLQDASIAMVEAKRHGGGRHQVFEPGLRERAARRAAIEADLHRALTEDELFVVYQPVVAWCQGPQGIDPAAGVEALVRWRHPERGIVPPGEFIGVAEECGLIGALGDRVLELACRQFVRWRESLGAQAPRCLAVNLSRAQLADPAWPERVRQLLAETGMPPGQLQLEVTESLAAQDEAVQARLHELKRLGLTLALDDFGTGYSSLASLHLLPVDTVKIDRAFISPLDTSAHHRALVEATVRVAASLGMQTVAEGIETPAQAHWVAELGCDKGQGFLFCRPLPQAELEAWLRARQAEPMAADA